MMHTAGLPLGFTLVAVGCLLSGCFGHNRENLAIGCRQGNSNDCLALGSMLLKGQGGRENPQEALEYFDLACALGNSIGCQRAGDVWDSGAIRFKNSRKAQEYYQKAKELEKRGG
jgi:TPR repeat protein